MYIQTYPRILVFRKLTYRAYPRIAYPIRIQVSVQHSACVQKAPSDAKLMGSWEPCICSNKQYTWRQLTIVVRPSYSSKYSYSIAIQKNIVLL